MKSIRIFSTPVISVILLSCFLLTSCNDAFLKEVPQGFLSPENTFTNKDGFDSGLADLYSLSRTIATCDNVPGMVSTEIDKSMTTLYASGTDLGFTAYSIRGRLNTGCC